MSIASEITRLQTAKADLKTAIEGKGVSVPSSAKLDAYPALVESIQQGGGGDEDVWYIVLMNNDYIYRMYPSVDYYNDRWDFLARVRMGRELNGYVCFKYKNENYYIDSFTDGNHTLSKQGSPVNNTIDLLSISIYKEGNLFKVNIIEN